MRLIATVSAVVLICLATSPATSSNGYPEQLRKVKTVSVFVEDGVKGGCLPNPNVLKTEAELILRRSGVKVKAELDLWEHNLYINVAGGPRPGTSCAALLSIELIRNEVLRDGTIGAVLAYGSGGVLTGGKSGFQQFLRETVNEYISDLANEILKARQE